MQQIDAKVRNNVRAGLLPFLQINSPIKGSEAKSRLLNELGYTKDQFGFSNVGGYSKIENLIGNEFARLKNLGITSQQGSVWMMADGSSKQLDLRLEEPSLKHEPSLEEPALEEPSLEEGTVQMVVNPVVDSDPDEEDKQEEMVLIEEDKQGEPNRLLNCDGFRNSLIEATSCYGSYSKKDCEGCLLALWCEPFSLNAQSLAKAVRQAKKQAKNSKEALLEKYAGKKDPHLSDRLSDLLILISNHSVLKNNAGAPVHCMFSQEVILDGEDCVFVKNFGIISMNIFNDIKDAGLVQ